MIKVHFLYIHKFKKKKDFIFSLSKAGNTIVKHFPTFFICTAETIESLNYSKSYKHIITLKNKIYGSFFVMSFNEKYSELIISLSRGLKSYTTTELHSRNVIEPTIPFPIYISKLITYL